MRPAHLALTAITAACVPVGGSYKSATTTDASDLVGEIELPDTEDSSTTLCPDDRYEILDAGTGIDVEVAQECPLPGSTCDGSGLVLDKETGLRWLRFEYFPIPASEVSAGDPGQHFEPARAYCEGRQMRLPTLEEAENIAGENHLACVFPYWATWTSTIRDSGLVAVLRNDGLQLDLDPERGVAPALCVMDP